MLVNIEPIQPDAPATPNLWNTRFSAITSAINGNIDSDNLKNNAVTTEKIANNAVTSDKLGFNKYVDDNGWLITDLGLVKLATKAKPFTISGTLSPDEGGNAHFAANVNNAPVRFSSSTPYNMSATFYFNTANSSRLNINFIQTPKLTPTTGIYVRNVSNTNTSGITGTVEEWIIF